MGAVSPHFQANYSRVAQQLMRFLYDLSLDRNLGFPFKASFYEDTNHLAARVWVNASWTLQHQNGYRDDNAVAVAIPLITTRCRRMDMIAIKPVFYGH